jgi:hypothetical protein
LGSKVNRKYFFEWSEFLKVVFKNIWTKPKKLLRHKNLFRTNLWLIRHSIQNTLSWRTSRDSLGPTQHHTCSYFHLSNVNPPMLHRTLQKEHL